MPSDGCRSCDFNEVLNININNISISFPDISAVEETLENLFLSSYFKYNYSSENFKIDSAEEQITVAILNNTLLILKDENDLWCLESELCNLLKNDAANLETLVI